MWAAVNHQRSSLLQETLNTDSAAGVNLSQTLHCLSWFSPLYLLVVYLKKKNKKNVMTNFFLQWCWNVKIKSLKKKSSSIPLPFYRVSQFSAVNGRSLGQSGQGHVTIHLNHSPEPFTPVVSLVWTIIGSFMLLVWNPEKPIQTYSQLSSGLKPLTFSL